jgi:tRNA-dihydrouridine synthase A
VLHGDRDQLIGFDPFEHPVALQLGGCVFVPFAAAWREAGIPDGLNPA